MERNFLIPKIKKRPYLPDPSFQLSAGLLDVFSFPSPHFRLAQLFHKSLILLDQLPTLVVQSLSAETLFWIFRFSCYFYLFGYFLFRYFYYFIIPHKFFHFLKFLFYFMFWVACFKRNSVSWNDPQAWPLLIKYALSISYSIQNSENYPNQFSLPYSPWRVKFLTFYFQRALTYICVVFIYQFRSSFIEYLFPTE